MRKTSELFARLQLRPDANEKDVRRAYARELRKIDQEHQAQAFQDLRETYDQLLWWVRQRQQTATAPDADVQDVAFPAPETSPNGAQQRDVQSAPPTASSPVYDGLPSSEALGRQMLDFLLQHLAGNEMGDRQAVATFLRRCLDDPRLGSVDAATYFEWGVASVLAGGWAPGHDLLLGPSITCFGWREDRSRLLWFGRPGEVVDAAINELLAFDTQPAEHRALQKEAIRKLRVSHQMSTGELLRQLPIAEYVVAAFPNWMHVISRPQNLMDWRRWHREVPAWRKMIARRPRFGLTRSGTSTATAGRMYGTWSMVLLILTLVSVLGSVSRESVPDPQPTPFEAIGSANLASAHRQSQQEKELRERVQAGLGAFIASPDAQLLAIREQNHAGELAKATASKESCQEVATHAHGHLHTYARGAFTSAFDRLVLECFAKNLGGVSQDIAEIAKQNDRHRNRADTSSSGHQEKRTVHGRSYGEQIASAIRSNIDQFEASKISGNPSAAFDVRIAADGTIRSVSLKSTSGHQAWDEHARRALLRTKSFPLDVDGKMPAHMVIHLRPK